MEPAFVALAVVLYTVILLILIRLLLLHSLLVQQSTAGNSSVESAPGNMRGAGVAPHSAVSSSQADATATNTVATIFPRGMK